jgi:Fe2+ or Zn2+ uptake regulation protein
MPTLSLATVYKTLDTLAAIGAVRPVSRLGARGRWDANLGPHHHLICTACGAVSDVTEPALDAAGRPARRVAARLGFAAAGHAVEIFGRCAACRRAQPSSPHPKDHERSRFHLSQPTHGGGGNSAPIERRARWPRR